MKKVKFTRLLFIAGLCMAVASGVYAQNGPGMGKGGKGGGKGKGQRQHQQMKMRRKAPPSPEQVADNMTRELNLSADQHEKVKSLIGSNQPVMREYAQNMKKLKIDIRNRMFAADSTLEEVNTLIDKLAVAQAEHMKKRVENQFKLKDILSPEQYKKFLASAKTRLAGRKRSVKRKFQVTQTVRGTAPAPKLPQGPEASGAPVPSAPTPAPAPDAPSVPAPAPAAAAPVE